MNEFTNKLNIVRPKDPVRHNNLPEEFFDFVFDQERIASEKSPTVGQVPGRELVWVDARTLFFSFYEDGRFPTKVCDGCFELFEKWVEHHPAFYGHSSRKFALNGDDPDVYRDDFETERWFVDSDSDTPSLWLLDPFRLRHRY